MIAARPFDGPTSISDEQLEVMYLGLPTKGRLAFDEAELALIDEGLRVNPDDYFLWCARAALMTDASEAVECYSQALRVRPLASHALYNRGRKLLGLASTAMAAADLRAATVLDPDEPWKWHFLGVSLYFLERYEDAVAAFEAAVAAAERAGEPLLPFELEWVWNCHMKRGDADEAAASISRVDERTPVLPSEATYKRRILLYRGALTEAEFLDGIDREDAVEAANQLYGYANHLHYLRGDTAGSVAVLREVLATAPGGAGWGAKMAALDLVERERQLQRGDAANHPEPREKKGGSL
ncbi:tetratricopeptide repeat protein [Agromyces silvae]|uniref:tetratricopeptide repeat protein n=1 Tax=Agromyces silvae TaxID=3388266 RepID=UPI00280AA8F1|nr:tetratricopeptide repeat protein [Agromyces protaetiae]